MQYMREPHGSDVSNLHGDDAPITLRLLDALFGRRSDRAELGYHPNRSGAEVHWDRLTGGALSTTEVAVAHIALGCAFAEHHRGPGAGRGRRPRTNGASRRALTTDDDVTPLPPGIDL